MAATAPSLLSGLTRQSPNLSLDPRVTPADDDEGKVVSPVAWRDLVPISRWEAVKEVLLPLPWLAGSLALAACGIYPAALALSFVFFLTGLRLNHGGCHYAIGLGRGTTNLVLLALSVAMLGAMHAVQWNHLRHHRHCLAADDIEAMGARRSWLGAVL